MSVFSGPADWWTDGTNIGRTHIATKGIVQSGLVLNLDAGVSTSYPGSGTTWTDLSGNGNTGTLTNGPTYSSTNGGSIVFDGTNDYVQTSFVPPAGQSSRTFSLWFNPVSPQNKNLLGYGTESGLAMWDIILYDGTVGVHLYGSGAESPTSYTSGIWQNVVFTYTHPEIKTYKNGSLVNSYTNASINTGTGNSLSIGKGVFGPYFYCSSSISNINIYNRTLSASEIQQNFNALRSRFGI